MFLQKLRMVIESLIQLDKKDQAIFNLAKAPLKLTKERKLLNFLN